MQFKDYYQILGVEPNAGEAEIKTAYRRLARKYHPDVSKEAGAEERFKEVNEAYEALRDPAKRKEYDETRRLFAGGGFGRGRFSGGGGGNFGIVTSLTYRIHPLTQAIFVVATWPGFEDLEAVFESWQQSAPYADRRLTSQLEIEGDKVGLHALLAGGTEAEALQLLSPMLSIGSPDIVVQDATWPEIYSGFQIPITEEPANWKFASQFMTEPLPSDAVCVIAEFMAKAPEGCNYFTNAFGGALPDSEPSGGSAVAHRGALYYAEPGAGWGVRGGPPASDDQTEAVLAWVAELTEALAPYVNGAYVNVPNAGMPDWERAYWGPNVERLRQIKAAYDPDNVFSYAQSITA